MHCSVLSMEYQTGESNLLQYLSSMLLYSVDASTEGDQNKKGNYIVSVFEDINDSAEKKTNKTCWLLFFYQIFKHLRNVLKILLDPWSFYTTRGMIKLIMSSHNGDLQSYRKNKTTSNS